MNHPPAINVLLAAGVIFVLAILFVCTPDGWNLVPLLMIALVLGVTGARLKEIRRATHRPPPTPPTPTESDPASRQTPADQPRNRELAKRANRAFGPIMAGMIIDLVDAALLGPLHLILGFPIGALAGYWMGRALGLRNKASWWCALAAGIYCSIPGTEFIPLGTIVGACVRFKESGESPHPTVS